MRDLVDVYSTGFLILAECSRPVLPVYANEIHCNVMQQQRAAESLMFNNEVTPS